MFRKHVEAERLEHGRGIKDLRVTDWSVDAFRDVGYRRYVWSADRLPSLLAGPPLECRPWSLE